MLNVSTRLGLNAISDRCSNLVWLSNRNMPTTTLLRLLLIRLIGKVGKSALRVVTEHFSGRV